MRYRNYCSVCWQKDCLTHCSEEQDKYLEELKQTKIAELENEKRHFNKVITEFKSGVRKMDGHEIGWLNFVEYLKSRIIDINIELENLKAFQ